MQRQAGVGPRQPLLRPDVANGETVKEETGNDGVVAAQGRQAGKFYLVVQDMLGNGAWEFEEAGLIVKFLATKGFRADVSTLGEGPRRRWCVWSLQPQADKDSKPAKDAIDKMEQWGWEYNQKRKKDNAKKFYNFSRPYYSQPHSQTRN